MTMQTLPEHAANASWTNVLPFVALTDDDRSGLLSEQEAPAKTDAILLPWCGAHQRRTTVAII